MLDPDLGRSVLHRHFASLVNPSRRPVMLIFLVFFASFCSSFPVLSLLMRSPAPSGADPGNWLAFAWQLTGEYRRLAYGVYPPAFISFLRFLLVFLDPIVALKTSAVISLVLLSACFLFSVILLRVPLPVLLGSWLVYMLSGYHGEVLSFGGYPQLVAVGFLILALVSTERWLLGDGRYYWIFSAIFSATVVYTHHLMALSLFALMLILVVWIIAGRWRHRWLIIRRFSFVTVAVIVLVLPVIPIYFFLVTSIIGNPLNPHSVAISEFPRVFRYIFLEAPVLWLGLFGLALMLPIFWHRRLGSGTVFVLGWGTVTLFLLLRELRILHLLVSGAAIALALSGREIFRDVAEKKGGLLLPAIFCANIAVIAILLGMSTFERTRVAIDWYRVVDDNVMSALYWLRAETPADSLVLASLNPRNYIYGWWIEGLSRRHTIYQSDPRWLIFRDERYWSNIANKILDPETPLDEAVVLLREKSVDYIFVDKFSDVVPSVERFRAIGLISLVYENWRISIYAVSG